MYLVIFDCDGTLTDSQNTIVHGIGVGFEAVGLKPPSREKTLSIVGLSLEVAFARLVGPEKAELAPVMAEAYKASKLQRRREGLDHDPLYPGAIAAIDRLSEREDVLLGVATGKALRGVRHMEEVHRELKGRFTTIQTADTAPSKPHPGMVLQALGETGVEAHRAIMVGDTTYDMEMAVAAGVLPLGVSWGYHPREALISAGALEVIDHFDQLYEAISRHLKFTERAI